MYLSRMEKIQSKTPQEIERLAEGFARGSLFTGLHIALGEGYADKSAALRTCFLPLNTYSQAQWLEFRAAQWVPFQWVKQATSQLSKVPPLYVFPEFEFMTLEDGLAVLRYAGALHRQRLATA